MYEDVVVVVVVVVDRYRLVRVDHETGEDVRLQEVARLDQKVGGAHAQLDNRRENERTVCTWCPYLIPILSDGHLVTKSLSNVTKFLNLYRSY